VKVLEGFGRTSASALDVLASAPNWAEIVTAVGSALAGGTLLIGVGTAWFGLRQLAESKRDRHVTVLAELGKRWDDDKLVESRTKRFHTRALS
jgi:hypothetical protein